MRFFWQLASFAAGALPCGAASVIGGIAPSATIANGTVHGLYNEHFHQDFFLGVPFGDAPRLDDPKPRQRKFPNGALRATQYGPTCVGFGSNELLNLTLSEDCLNLNIVRPAEASQRQHGLLPVLVWIYGGGYSQGASADPMWNLSYIVNQSTHQAQPILAVSINYRLSFFGFPSGAEALHAGVTNLGLKDQRLALQWIQANIATFGGDPARVTVWGESAGGSSIAYQLIAQRGRGSAGLFHRAILVSGFITGENAQYANASQARYNTLVKDVGCAAASSPLECLRHAPLDALRQSLKSNAAVGTSWPPVIDGRFIADKPALELAAGHVHRVPIVLGANSDEGLFVTNLLQSLPNTTAELRAEIQQIFAALSNETVDQLLAAYPPTGPAPPYSLPPDYDWCAAMRAAHLACGAQYRRQSALLGDYFADAPRRLMASSWAQLGLPAFSFRFDTNPTDLPIQFWTGLGPGFALHGAELAYEFGLPPGFTTPIHFYPPVKQVATHAELSRQMMRRWISFAHMGDPTGYGGDDGAPNWPDYRIASQNYVFNATDTKLNTHVEKDRYREGPIQLWNDHVIAVNYGTA